MSSHYRTVALGLGVGAICLVMASLKWQHLLMFFALAGVGWALWSWFRSGSRNAVQIPGRSGATTPISGRRVHTPGDNNVYQFPAKWNVPDVGS